MEPMTRPGRPVDAVTDHIRTAVLSGQIKAGEHLPAERTLAVQLGVNRLTLRAALARLETEGLVRARQGDGVRVLDWRTQGGLDVLAHLRPVDNLEMVRAFLEMRRAMAAEAVAVACVRATAQDRALLAELATAQQNEADPRVFAERDLQFGRAMLVAARNPAMVLLLNEVEGVYRAQPDVMEALHADRAAVRRSYTGVVALLEARQPELARTSVRQALEYIDLRALRHLRRKAAAAAGKA